MRTGKVVPVIRGELEPVSHDIDQWLEEIRIENPLDFRQKVCLLGTPKIIKMAQTLERLLKICGFLRLDVVSYFPHKSYWEQGGT